MNILLLSLDVSAIKAIAIFIRIWIDIRMKIIFTLMQISKCIFQEYSTKEFYGVMNERKFPNAGRREVIG